MSTNEIRSYALDLEIREDENGGRTIYGIAVPYDKEQRISGDTTEVFRRGAFADVIKAAHRVKLLRNHDSKSPIGRATLLRETDEGLYAEFKVSRTREGDDALELVKDGALDQLSIGFMPIKNRKRTDGVIERLKAHLAEVSLVTFGAYGDLATVNGVRSHEPMGTPRLDAAKAILDAIQHRK
ncbi:MAG: HK97 family phage prohead protease [Acidimicrobiia bacterium]|nr:HK97 family phage prohead protease [Actinomycetota bacterium]NDC92055.1 HK97 family phage prohead protease [Acidimicrobiia bacterium]